MRVIVLGIHVRGADAVSRELCEWVWFFQRQGHTVRVFVEQATPDAPPDVLACTTVTTANQLRHSDDWQILESADLLLCIYPAYFSLAESLRLLTGPTVIFSYAGVTPPSFWPEPQGRAYLEQSRCRAALVHFCDLAVTHSFFTRDELHQLTGFPLERIWVIPNVVPHPPAEPSPVSASNAAPMILSVGRLAAHKQPQLLVEALALVRQTLPQAQLVLVGDARGPSHAPVLQQVRERAAALGVSEAVLCTGTVDQAGLERLYARAHVLTSASAHEGFCVPVGEAFARGVPVVVMNGGALAETVGDAGIVVPAGDIQALATALMSVIQDDALRQHLIVRGRERATNFTAQSVGALIQAMLEQLPPRHIRPSGLPRLSQLVDLKALDAAAEIAPAPDQTRRSIPIVSRLAAKLRRWLQSDLRRELDIAVGRQVAYNRQLNRNLHAIDEWSASISEAEAARRHSR